MTRLADEMSLDRTTLTRNIQVLQREGLVSMAPGQDRRVHEVALSEKGHTVLQQAVPLWEEAEAALTERLGADTRKALLSYLSVVSCLEENNCD